MLNMLCDLNRHIQCKARKILSLIKPLGEDAFGASAARFWLHLDDIERESSIDSL